jgi:hypothetical protein
MEASDTQQIFDGESTYYLAAYGFGKWSVKMGLWARKTGGGVAMVKLDEVSVSADFYYNGVPFPRYKTATLTELFHLV